MRLTRKEKEHLFYLTLCYTSVLTSNEIKDNEYLQAIFKVFLKLRMDLKGF